MSSNLTYTLHQGDNISVLKTYPDNHFDSVVTDPPYGIDFLGKDWDSHTGSIDTYRECYRVLKPGGHLLAFSAARTYHHLAMSVELAGFEIRDQIMWIYSSGFPKSQDVGRSIERSTNKKAKKTKSAGYNPTGENKPVDTGVNGFRCYTCGKDSAARYDCKNDPCQLHPPLENEQAKQWAGWGTALKPAHEPIVVARKPLKLSVAKNVQQWGTGALNIDATRIAYASGEDPADFDPANNLRDTQSNALYKGGWGGKKPSGGKGNKATFTNFSAEQTTKVDEPVETWEPSNIGRFPSNVLGDIPEYQKYFYCPKVSRRERHIGFELPPPMFGQTKGAYDEHGNRMAVGLDAQANGIPTTREMLKEMGGYFVDSAGNEIADGTPGKNCYVPHLGQFKAHGIKHEYELWHKNNGTQPRTPGNNHPTVKPQQLMEYLIKLVTPPGGRVLDPFNGSGSTGMAATRLGHEYVGIDLDPKYIEISRRRIEAWNQPAVANTYDQLFDEDDK